jgi:hypothetical protein
MKFLTPSCLALIVLAACSHKDADPQPAPVAPVQAATLDVKFDYYATTSLPASTQSKSLLADKPTWKQASDRLTITLEVLNVISTVDDHVDFVLPLSKQKPGLTGTYTVASQPNTTAGDALASYIRPVPSNSSAYPNVYTSNSNQVTGTLTITSYDAKRQLLSGTYQARYSNVKGPFSFLGMGSVGDPRRDGDLTISGTFQEIPLK